MATYEQVQQQAEKLEGQKQYGEAALLWERLRDYERAITAYRKAGVGERAAHLYELLGRPRDAAAMYASIGMYVQAATLYERARAYDLAARAYLRANQRDHAALMCERGELLADAAKIYASIGNYAKAIDLFNRAGDTQAAQEVAKKHGLSAQGQQAVALSEPAPTMEGEAGVMDERKVVSAVVYYLQHDKLAEAARWYSHCREDIGYPVIAAVAGNRDLELRLAKMLYAAEINLCQLNRTGRRRRSH